MINPVIVTTHYRRPQYSRRLFEAIRRGFELGHTPYGTPVFIHQDIDRAHAEKCLWVKDIIKGFMNWYKFFHADLLNDRDILYHTHEPKLGIDLSKIYAINTALKELDSTEGTPNFFIFLEDDTIPDEEFVSWCIVQGSRKDFIDNPDIFSMCGYVRKNYTENKESLPTSYIDVLYSKVEVTDGFCPWGWASWKHKWDSIFPNDGEKYKAETGEEANGRFDWWLHNTPNLKKIIPLVALVQSVGGEEGEHTPSPQWHTDNEYNQFGIWTIREEKQAQKTEE